MSFRSTSHRLRRRCAPCRPAGALASSATPVARSLTLALTLLVAGPTFAAKRAATARCTSIAPAKVKRVGAHWLLLHLERQRTAPPTDYRIRALEARVLDERTGQVQTLSVPLAPLSAALTKAVIGGQLVKVTRKGSRMDTFFPELRHVSDDGQTVALEIRSRDKAKGSQRALVLVHVKTQQAVVGAAFQEVPPRTRETAVHVGTDPTGGHLYVLNKKTKRPDGKVTASVRVVRVDPKTGGPRTLVAFTTAPRNNPGLSVGGHTHLSRDGRLLAIAEYLESPKGEAKVHVVDLAKARKVSFPTPATTYGVAISPDNQTLLLGSNRLGTLELWDLKSGKRLKKARGVKRLHKAFFSADGARVWVAGKGGRLAGYDAKTLKRRETRGLKDLFGKVNTGALYAELDPRPRGLPQTFALAADKHGFGKQIKLCTLPL